MKRICRNPWLILVLGVVLTGSTWARGAAAPDAPKQVPATTLLIGHRGLIHHAPENTRAGFAACLELRLGFELDVRRTKDGHLVCMHDETVNRTTTGMGKVADLTLAELGKLDAGTRFDPVFAGERVPTLDDVFALLHDRQRGPLAVAIDLKTDDPTVEADVVRLAVKHGVLDHLVCIGRAITEPAVRRRLREANPGAHVAVLADAAADLPAALAAPDADWLYLRFIPSAEQVGKVHAAGKRIFLSGPTVIRMEPEHRLLTPVAGADALLTDFPVEWRRQWRQQVFAPGAKLQVEAEGVSGGEGPAWHPELGILTSGNNGHIHQLDRKGQSRIYRKDARANGLLFDPQGRLIACEPGQQRITRTEPDGKITVLTDRYEGKRYNEPNDLTVDSQGRIYFSDPRYGKNAGKDLVDAQGQIIEGVYRIDPDGKVTRIIGRELERPNGVLVSPDDRYLFVADNNNDHVNGARKLYRFDLQKDGSVDRTTRKLLYDWGKGRGPDGIKHDQQGRLYVAAGLNKPNPPAEPAEEVKGGIYVLSPEGKLLAFLPVPRDEVTNCAFGGDDLKTLYITAGGTIYSIRTTTPGCVAFPAGATRSSRGPWKQDELRQPPKVALAEEGKALTSLYYEAEPYQGKPTRVFAYLARPENVEGKLPAMVLVHGGGGTAFKEWAELWAKRGYIALAMDLAGQGPDRKRRSDGGPPQDDGAKFGAGPIKDSWSYHAVANVIRGVSLLAARPDVDPDRIGITGISWGGYLTCIVAGLDDRLKVAVPVYGCGFLHENSTWLPTFAKMADARRQVWIENFEPSRYVDAARMPVLFVNGTNDFAYPLDSYQKTYRLVKQRDLCVTVNMPHGHPQGWAPVEIGLFVDQHLRTGKPLARIEASRRDGGKVEMKFKAEVPATSAALHFTTDTGAWTQRKWQTQPARIDGTMVTADLPSARPLVYFLTVTDQRKATVSTEHETLEK